MIDDIQFSGRGRSPTAFEVRLLHQVPRDTPWGALAHRLIRDHGPAAGAALLCVVLDELGAGRIVVPDRERYFRSLWRTERDALIVDLATRPDWSRADIAELVGVSEVWVGRVLAGATVHARP